MHQENVYEQPNRVLSELVTLSVQLALTDLLAFTRQANASRVRSQMGKTHGKNWSLPHAAGAYNLLFHPETVFQAEYEIEETEGRPREFGEVEYSFADMMEDVGLNVETVVALSKRTIQEELGCLVAPLCTISCFVTTGEVQMNKSEIERKIVNDIVALTHDGDLDWVEKKMGGGVHPKMMTGSGDGKKVHEGTYVAAHVSQRQPTHFTQSRLTVSCYSRPTKAGNPYRQYILLLERWTFAVTNEIVDVTRLPDDELDTEHPSYAGRKLFCAGPIWQAIPSTGAEKTLSLSEASALFGRVDNETQGKRSRRRRKRSS